MSAPDPRWTDAPMRVVGPVSDLKEAHMLKQAQYLFELKSRLQRSLPRRR